MKVQPMFMTGLLGLAIGMLVGRIPAVRAQDPVPHVTQSDMRSHQFTLVDQNGRTRACLGFRNDKPVLSFFDEKGNLIVSLNPENLRVHPSPIGMQ